MNIVIYRQKMEDALEISEYLFNKLKPGLGEHLKISHMGLVMDIFDINIQFRCGDLRKLAGLRPDIYNVDSVAASNFLQRSAVKVGGKEINTLDDIYLEIIQHCMDVFNGNNAIMSKFAYDSLSKEEKKAFVELCKEDPAVFVERVVGVKLKEYQKVYIRETFKRLLKEKNDILRLQFQQEPVKPICIYCNYTGMVPIGPGVRGLMKCPYCG